MRRHVGSLLDFMDVLDYGELHEIAFEVALGMGYRAVDSFLRLVPRELILC